MLAVGVGELAAPANEGEREECAALGPLAVVQARLGALLPCVDLGSTRQLSIAL